MTFSDRDFFILGVSLRVRLFATIFFILQIKKDSRCNPSREELLLSTFVNITMQ